MMNFVFHLVIFLCDLKIGKSSKIEILFVFTFTYPQWRLVKILAGYFSHGDEERLNTEKKVYERDIETTEAYLEATFQVYFIGILQQYMIYKIQTHHKRMNIFL